MGSKKKCENINRELLDRIVKMQEREKSKFATSGFTLWALALAIVGIAYFILKNIDSMYNRANMHVFAITFISSIYLTKVLFIIINKGFRRGKLLAIHSINKNSIDKKFFWVGKPYEFTVILIMTIFIFYLLIDAFNIPLNLRIVLWTILIIDLNSLFWSFISFIIELFSKKVIPLMKIYANIDVMNVKRVGRIYNAFSLFLYSLSVLFLTIFIIINYIHLIPYNKEIIALALATYLIIILLEVVLIVICKNIKIAELEKLEKRILLENISKEDIEKIIKNEFLIGSNLDDFI